MSYFFIYFLVSLLAIYPINRTYNKPLFYVLFVIFVIFSGFRENVGGDWKWYLQFYNDAAEYSFYEYINISKSDKAYSLLNWISFSLGAKIYFVNVIVAIIFFIGLLSLCVVQPFPFLAVAVSTPYMIFVVSMGYSRQAAAIGLFMAGLRYLSDRKTGKYVVCIIIASFFHLSAVIMAPLAALYQDRIKISNVLIIGVITMALFYFVMNERIDSIIYNYVLNTTIFTTSTGALPRLIMSAIPALICIVLYKKIINEWEDYKIWLIFSIAVLLLFTLVGVASTAVDRLALFLQPLQLVVFSRIPTFFHNFYIRRLVIVFIVFYYFLTLYIWIYYSSNSKRWIPYDNYLGAILDN